MDARSAVSFNVGMSVLTFAIYALARLFGQHSEPLFVYGSIFAIMGILYRGGLIDGRWAKVGIYAAVPGALLFLFLYWSPHEPVILVAAVTVGCLALADIFTDHMQPGWLTFIASFSPWPLYAAAVELWHRPLLASMALCAIMLAAQAVIVHMYNWMDQQRRLRVLG